MLLEFWLLNVARRDPLEVADSATAGVSQWILAGSALILILLSYAVGMLCRTLAFSLYRRMSGFTDGAALVGSLRNTFGESHVERAIEVHPPLRVALGKKSSGEIVAYAKLWLRERRPILAVDHFEYEINFLVGLAPPLVLLPVIAARLATEWSWRVSVLAALPGFAFAWLALMRAVQLGTHESHDVVRNLIFAQWFGAPEAPDQPRSDGSSR